jgi:PAS domain S-box-containing protein
MATTEIILLILIGGGVLYALLRSSKGSMIKPGENGVVSGEEKYRNLIENIGVVMYSADTKGLITFANREVTSLTGYSAAELKDKHFSILLAPEWVQQVSLFYLNQYRTLQSITTLQFQIRTKSGEIKWVEQSTKLSVEEGQAQGFQCIVKDITVQKQVENELALSEIRRKENEYRLNAILENTTTLIFIKDLAGRYLMVNRCFKEAFGVTDEMVLEKTDFDFNLPERADYFQKVDDEVIRTRRPVQREELVKTANGKRNLLLVKFPLLDDKQEVFGVSGIATDITEIVQTRLQADEAMAGVREANELQEQFLANISHELRTPLTGIHGMTDLLLTTSMTDEQKEFAATIRRSVDSLQTILNNILDFSNLKAGKLLIQQTIIEVREIVDEIREQFAFRAGEKQLRIDSHIQDDVPAVVTGDMYRLKQVLSNLVDNAIKFTAEGSIRIEVGVLDRNENRITLVFTISDTGIGVAPDKLETIFRSFAQAGIDISRNYGGTGLGLAISRGLVRLQGGDMSVQNDPGGGAVFSFHIPYAIAEEQSTVDLLSGRHFLVADDNPTNQRLISLALQKKGAGSDLASNGREVIDLLQKNTRYDLIIMDLIMPEMGGYEAIVYIRKTLQLPIPIIALTATVLKEDEEKCRAAGVNDFMVKPFSFKDLFSRINRVLSGNDPYFAEMNTTCDEQENRVYDLALLEELDDKGYVAEMIELFLKNTPGEFETLVSLTEAHNWKEVSVLAHRIKGSVAMMQSSSLVMLLKTIEKDTKEGGGDYETVRQQVEKARALFATLEQQLQEELGKRKKELSL